MVDKILKKYNIMIDENYIIQNNHEYRFNDKFNFDNKIISNGLDIDFLSGSKLKSCNYDKFLNIVDDFIAGITGKSYKHFTDIIIIEENDFNSIKQLLIPNENMNFDGIRLIEQNIIFINDRSNVLALFRMIFHEIAHSWNESINVFEDEYNAMIFEIKVIDKLMESISTNEITYSTNHDNYCPFGTIHFEAMEKALKTCNKKNK